MNNTKINLNICFFLVILTFLPIVSTQDATAQRSTTTPTRKSIIYGTTGLLLLTSMGIGLKTKKTSLNLARRFSFFNRPRPLETKYNNNVTPYQFEIHKKENKIFQQKTNQRLTELNKRLTDMQSKTNLQNKDTRQSLSHVKQALIDIKRNNL